MKKITLTKKIIGDMSQFWEMNLNQSTVYTNGHFMIYAQHVSCDFAAQKRGSNEYNEYFEKIFIDENLGDEIVFTNLTYTGCKDDDLVIFRDVKDNRLIFVKVRYQSFLDYADKLYYDEDKCMIRLVKNCTVIGLLMTYNMSMDEICEIKNNLNGV